MPRQRLVLGLLLAVLGVALLGAAVSQGPDDERAEKPAPRPPARPATVTAGTLPRDGRVEASVGDVVELRVTSRRPDRVELVDLGIEQDVGPRDPAVIELVAERPGYFPVTSELDGRRVGVLLVTQDR